MDDLKDRYQKCMLAMTPMTDRKAAAMVCAEAVYGSRGYIIRPTSSSRKTRSRNRTRSRQSQSQRRSTQRR